MRYREFELNTDQRIAIARSFCEAVSQGMQSDVGPLPCLPTPVQIKPQNTGRALVLDFGGTHMRAAVVTIDETQSRIEKGPVKANLPIERGRPLARSAFLDIQTRLIESLDPEPGLPLGYCFSYPAAQTPDGDARLIHWTKGVNIPGVVGEKVGRMLIKALNDRGIVCTSVMVVNDTVACLLAGLTEHPADAHIGLVVGTGTNMACMIDSRILTKLPPGQRKNGLTPVNLESGNFTPAGLTVWDERVDRQSDNPNRQRFEKAVSGAYLTRLVAEVLPQACIDPAESAALLSRWTDGSKACDPEQRELATLILQRSAGLVAASLAGLLLFLDRHHPIRSVLVETEGALIQTSPGFRDRVHRQLTHLVDLLGLQTERIDLVQIPQANLIGCALAALNPPQPPPVT